MAWRQDNEATELMITGMPSVLHFLWNGEIGGAERAVYQLVREQQRRGLHVGVAFGQATGLYADSLRRLGCPVISFDASGGADLRVLPHAVRAIRKYDLHHFHAAEPLTFLASLLSGSKARVFTQRAGTRDTDTGRKRLRRHLARHTLLHHFHAWCGNTPNAQEALTEILKVHPDAIDMIYNGLDFELLRPAAARNEVRRSFGISEDAFVVGSTAVLKEWKRMHLLLEAGAKLDRSNFTLLIVGDGPDKPRLEDHARVLGIQDLVVFTGMQDRVVELVNAMDAFVLPSSSAEAFGNSVVEAMALGVPSTVFADSPGIRKHIEPGETGFVVGDVNELVDTLNRLRFDPGLRARVGEAGANYVRKTYGIQRSADSYAAVYLKAVSRQTALRAHPNRSRDPSSP